MSLPGGVPQGPDRRTRDSQVRFRSSACRPSRAASCAGRRSAGSAELSSATSASAFSGQSRDLQPLHLAVPKGRASPARRSRSRCCSPISAARRHRRAAVTDGVPGLLSTLLPPRLGGVLGHDGLVDKFVGDEVIGLFFGGVPAPQHAPAGSTPASTCWHGPAHRAPRRWARPRRRGRAHGRRLRRRERPGGRSTTSRHSATRSTRPPGWPRPRRPGSDRQRRRGRCRRGCPVRRGTPDPRGARARSDDQRNRAPTGPGAATPSVAMGDWPPPVREGQSGS